MIRSYLLGRCKLRDSWNFASKYSFADVSSVIEELFNFYNIHNLNLLETQVLVLVLILRRKVLFTSLPMLSCVSKSQFKCDCIFTLNSKNNFCEDIGLLEAVRLVHYKQPSASCYSPAVRSRQLDVLNSAGEEINSKLLVCKG